MCLTILLGPVAMTLANSNGKLKLNLLNKHRLSNFETLAQTKFEPEVISRLGADPSPGLCTRRVPSRPHLQRALHRLARHRRQYTRTHNLTISAPHSASFSAKRAQKRAAVLRRPRVLMHTRKKKHAAQFFADANVRKREDTRGTGLALQAASDGSPGSAAMSSASCACWAACATDSPRWPSVPHAVIGSGRVDGGTATICARTPTAKQCFCRCYRCTTHL
jgi:hypothetical protein